MQRVNMMCRNNIVRLNTFKEINHYLFIITPVFKMSLPELELREYLDVYGSYHMLHNICTAIQEFHSNDLIIGNLKPSNILYDDYSEFLISDYCKYLLMYNTNDTNLTYADINDISFISPEMIKNENITKESDIWSFGCLIYYIISGGKLCFSGNTIYNRMNNIINKNYISLSPSIPFNEYLNEFILKLVEINVYKRYTIDEVKYEINKLNEMIFLKTNINIVVRNNNNNNNSIYFIEKNKYKNLIISNNGRKLHHNNDSGYYHCYLNLKLDNNCSYKIKYKLSGDESICYFYLGATTNNDFDEKELCYDESSCCLWISRDMIKVAGGNGKHKENNLLKEKKYRDGMIIELIFNLKNDSNKMLLVKFEEDEDEILLFKYVKTPLYPFVIDVFQNTVEIVDYVVN